MVVDPVVYKTAGDLDANDLRVRAKRKADREAAAQEEMDNVGGESMAELLGSTSSDY